MSRWLGAVAALLLALPSAAAACSPSTPPDPRVPSWQSVAGFPLGERAATPAQIDRYLRAVDAGSNRVTTFLAGRSGEGRPIRVAVVSTPDHLARLQHLAAEMRGLRAATFSAKRTRAIAATRPAFAWIGGSVHGNEPSGGDADMRLLAELATGRTCADLARLRRLVVFLLPTQNPDGRAAGNRVNARGFDLNRDWFARTQPETQAKVAALTRYPPVVFADQHEQGGTGFFFPPNADPIHHEVSSAALAAINGVFGPALRTAFDARGLDYTNYDTYDLFFMGYGDSVPSTLFGAAGMTYEKGNESPYPEKTAEHHLAAERTLRAAAAHRRALLGAWAQQWRQARGQGARGALQPNRVVQPGDTVQFQVPDEKVYGYVLRGDRHRADALTLVRRLTSTGVRVRETASEASSVPAYRAYGEAAAGPATLPAGTFIVPMAQPNKHWVQALLGEDPHVPFPYFYDVSGWSNPLLMGLSGGLLTAPFNVATVAAKYHRPPNTSGAMTFAGDSERAAELAFALLGKVIAVTRDGTGAFTATGDEATIVAEAARHAVDVAPTGLSSGTTLRRPEVGLLEDAVPDSSGGWARWLLTQRYGLKPATLSGEAIAGTGLNGLDVLVVPGGTASPDQLSAVALAKLQAWVRAGGTLVGWRSRGLGVAQAAGLTAVTTAPSPASLQVPGVIMRVALEPADPVALGEEAESWAFNDADPIFTAHGAPVAARYPGAARFFISGHASGTEALYGSPAVTDEIAGAGRVVLFAFDPVFRGYVESTERLVANALLAPAPGGVGRRSAPRAIDPAALAAGSDHRDMTIQVAAEDEAGLVAAARAAGVPGGYTLARDLTTVTLRLPNPRGLDAEQRPWTRRLPGALRAAGVVPLLAVF